MAEALTLEGDRIIFAHDTGLTLSDARRCQVVRCQMPFLTKRLNRAVEARAAGWPEPISEPGQRTERLTVWD